MQDFIKENHLEYAGRTPLYNPEEVKTLFTLATDGKDRRDYVTRASVPDYWEIRDKMNVANCCMNELRLNCIKMRQNARTTRSNADDTQNVASNRLSVSNLI